MPKMLKLLIDNKAAAPRSHIVAAEKDATIYLYDAIVATDADAQWWGGVSAESLVKSIRSLKVDTIHLRINSPGGDVFAGRAIEQALRDTGAKVIAHIDGFAASAASFVMLAAAEIEMAPGAFIMIHNAWTIAMGNEAEMLKAAALLNKIDSSLVDSYVARTGNDKASITAWMGAETWFSAQEAVDTGFADRIAASDSKASAQGAWNLSAYSNAPKLAAHEPEIAPEPPAPEAPAAPEPEPVPEDNTLNDQLLRALQLALATA